MSSDPRHAMEPRFGTTNDANRARSHLSHLGRWTAHSTIAVALTRSQNQQVVATGAISSARFALSWPLTSLRSRPAVDEDANFASGGGNSCVPLILKT